MRTTLWRLVASAAMTGCAGKADTTNLVFYVDPPDDTGCIGVVGFDVSISSGGRTSMSGPLLGSAPILDGFSCHLSRPFSFPNADLNGPASVTVSGHDGAGVVRVEGTGSAPKLVDGAIHIPLKTSAPPPSPVIVLNRSFVLNNAKLSDVTQLQITTMKGMNTLVAVIPGDYFSVDPAAYGVAAYLGRGGTDTNLSLFVDVTIAGMMQRTRMTAVWRPGGYYEAVP